MIPSNHDPLSLAIVGLGLLIIGAALYLIVVGVVEGVRGNRSAWYRVAARFGYVVLVATVIEGVYRRGSPKTPREWIVILALVLTGFGFVGTILELRKGVPA